jgi:hypothetical protein
MQRSAGYSAILHAGDRNTFTYCDNDSHRYRNAYACAYHLNGNAYIHACRFCNRNPDAHCCDRYTYRFRDQYSYCHLNTHQHTHTLRIRLIEKPP